MAHQMAWLIRVTARYARCRRTWRRSRASLGAGCGPGLAGRGSLPRIPCAAPGRRCLLRCRRSSRCCRWGWCSPRRSCHRSRWRPAFPVPTSRVDRCRRGIDRYELRRAGSYWNCRPRCSVKATPQLMHITPPKRVPLGTGPPGKSLVGLDRAGVWPFS